MKNGFTLIETIIYIALLSMLIGGGLITAFYIVDTSRANATDINIEAEGNFLLRKFEWVMNGSAITTLADTSLTVSKNGTTYVLAKDGANMELDGVVLNSLLVSVTLPASGKIFASEDPEGVIFAFKLNGKEFSAAKFTRK
ncbi:MAG: hypothetical protein UW30_C0011G0027 [Candidatus Giovannonibacteria bacterium GW2011_GWA2_44_13b]|uniref:Uncharacterized protein n=2 Tax=Candidatus Giovannoniibacteriota TaxID=1752738 RepID=A0A0G1H1F6_9BACT|nr:MAG: hypothetical protein UW30_C0011G0027 [Candidatus Giovannonibacteria bacterium GW2011_GWA2_44_13b]OGF82084.1 MAG: hypothetical protein A2924_01970 [Candidatus Giovannonibacteria bacterium RIFCSPLOWO2_01_FULL_44_16]